MKKLTTLNLDIEVKKEAEEHLKKRGIILSEAIEEHLKQLNEKYKKEVEQVEIPLNQKDVNMMVYENNQMLREILKEMKKE